MSRKVIIIGAADVGKTTLAAAIASVKEGHEIIHRVEKNPMTLVESIVRDAEERCCELHVRGEEMFNGVSARNKRRAKTKKKKYRNKKL